MKHLMTLSALLFALTVNSALAAASCPDEKAGPIAVSAVEGFVLSGGDAGPSSPLDEIEGGLNYAPGDEDTIFAFSAKVRYTGAKVYGYQIVKANCELGDNSLSVIVLKGR